MVELDESIEAVDAAIEYKNDILLERAVDYTAAVGNLLLDELVHLPLAETRSLLHKYFIRVLDLRLEGRKQEVRVEEVEEQYNDLGRYVRDLAHSLQRSKLDAERRLVAQQRDYQTKINLLVGQLAGSGGGLDPRPDRETSRKLRSLEKEANHYKRLWQQEVKSRDSAINDSAVKLPERELEIAAIGLLESTAVSKQGGVVSDTESTVSQVAPSQLAQFQRKLAKLQRKMEASPRPTVTREPRRLIIENPASTENSLDKAKKSRKKK